MHGRIVAGADRPHGTRRQHDQPVRGQREAQVVQHADDHLRAAKPRHLADQCHLVRRVEVGGRLIEQQHRRLHGQRPGEEHPLALAAREFGQAAVLPGLAFGVAHGLLDDGLVLRAGRGEQAELRQAAEVDDVAHGEFAAGFGLLREPGELAGAVAGRPGGERAAGQRDLARVERLQASECAQQRGLAGAVRADDGGPAAVEREGDAVEDGAGAEADLHVAGRDHPAISRRRSSHSR